MKVLFCKISSMKYYKGASQKDVPYNGGSYVNENGFGNEQYNFAAVQLDDGQDYCVVHQKLNAMIYILKK